MADTISLPRWVCHKKVEGDQIVGMTELDNFTRLHMRCGATVTVDDGWIKRHTPRVGGYYVVYEDGYTSFSPREAFEKGYAPITPHPQGA